MVDTGFIGVFLFIKSLFGFVAILKSYSNSKYVVSIVYLGIILWSLVGTIPLLLFYFG